MQNCHVLIANFEYLCKMRHSKIKHGSLWHIFQISIIHFYSYKNAKLKCSILCWIVLLLSFDIVD